MNIYPEISHTLLPTMPEHYELVEGRHVRYQDTRDNTHAIEIIPGDAIWIYETDGGAWKIVGTAETLEEAVEKVDIAKRLTEYALADAYR